MWFTIIGLAISAVSLGLQFTSGGSNAIPGQAPVAGPTAAQSASFNMANNAAVNDSNNFANALVAQENADVSQYNFLLIIGLVVTIFGLFKWIKK